MTDYLLHHNANTHWAFPTSAETDAAVASARSALADFLNANPDEVAFGANMTTLTFHLARAVGRRLGPGDAVVVTDLDHHANIDPWQALERERDVHILRVQMVPETGELDWDHLMRCLADHRTRVLAIGAASNAIGTINDIPRAVALAHEAGALAFVDAVHSAPHQLVDVREWDCDFLACSAYKFYGPHVGVFYGKRAQIESLDVPKLEPAPETAPERVESGTQNHEGIVGAAAAVDFLASLAIESTVPGVPPAAHTRRERLERVYDELHERGAALFQRLWNGLSGIDGVRVYGPPPGAPRTPTLACTIAGWTSGDAARQLSNQGIFASHGDFYAMTVAKRLGADRNGLLRFGVACYTNEEEIDRVIEAVRAIARHTR
jgi:cysteine desulfurase family protein (TIGR01976 family)